jgi:thiol:disulfide interchange protein
MKDPSRRRNLNRCKHLAGGGFALLVGFLFLSTAVAQQPGPQDPQFTPFGLPGLGGGSEENPLTLSGKYTIATGTREGLLSVKAVISPGWHVYSTTQKAGGPLPSRIHVEPSKAFEMSRPFVPDRLPHVKPPDASFSVPSEEYSLEVVWSAPFRVADSADPARLDFTVDYDGLACQDGGVCLPINKQPVPVTFAGEYAPPRRGEFSNPRVHAKIRGEAVPRTVQPGSTFQLRLTAEPAPSYHVYALADRDPKEVAKPALIAWKQQPGWTIKKPVASEKPIEKVGETAEETTQYYHENPVTWTIDIQVPQDAQAAGYELRGLLGYQTCTNKNCDPPTATEFSVVIAVTKAPDQVDTSAEPLAFKPASYTEVTKLAESGAGSSTARSSPVGPSESPAAPSLSSPPVDYAGPLLEIKQLEPVGSIAENRSVFVVLPAAFLAGFILNFMPCVLPVIGLKIVAFVQQAGQSRSRIFVLNVWYSLGLLSVFLVLASLAVFAGFGWGEQFQKPTFNIVLTAVVFAFALSFLGVWEIPLPGFVGGSSANKVADQEGPAGAFAKGVLTTVLATPCSGPLLVPALAWALRQPPALTYTVFVCVGLGMAFPYLVIGAFPRLIGLLPKPGAWMETFKQIMGFVLLGTVVYLLTLVPASLVIPTVAFLIGLWFALWWVGRVPVWDELNKRIRAWAFGTAFATLAAMFSFLWLAGQNNPSELAWQPYSRELLSHLLLAEKKMVFVDFTADWCPNCKVNERIALNVPQTKSFVESKGIATLKADLTYDSPPISELLQQLAGTTAIPVYAIFRPDDPYRPIVMEGLLTRSRLLETLAQASRKPGSEVVVAASSQ